MAPENDEIQPPEGLSADALDLFHDVIDTHGGSISPTSFHSLVQACRLITLADRLEASLGRDDSQFIVKGYNGQPVVSGVITECRLARAAAVVALKTAGLSTEKKSSSNAGRALAQQRWSAR